MRRSVAALGLTSTVRYLLAAKLVQLLSLPVTLVLIALSFTPEMQGFYFTFASLLALQSLLELGLHIVVLNTASQDSAHVQLDERGALWGEPAARARVVALGRFVLRWYSFGALLFLVVVGLGGATFFSMNPSRGVEWTGPWIALVIVSSLQFVVSPFNYLFDGLGQVASVARMRWLAATATAFAAWTIIWFGGGLWTLCGASAAALVANVLLLCTRYPEFFRTLVTERGGSIDWRREIWPMQWRLALQGAVNFLFYSLFNPVIFHYHGAEEAGRFGMTLQILGGIQMLSLAWIQAESPRFGQLVALKHFDELDRRWRASALRAILVSLAGNLAIVAAVPLLARYAPPLGERLGDLATVTMLAGAYLLSQPIQCMAFYLRAFRREVLTWIGFVSGMACGILVWRFGAALGAHGAAGAFLLVTTFFALPGVAVVWARSRAKWRAELGSSET